MVRRSCNSPDRCAGGHHLLFPRSPRRRHGRHARMRPHRRWFSGGHCRCPSSIMIQRSLVVAAALLVTGCSGPTSPQSVGFPAGELVDLSHTYDETTVFWPTSDTFRVEKTFDGITPGGYYYASNNFFTAEHGGTHLDAPLHFSRGAQAVDQIPLERFFGAAVVIDVVARADADADYQIGVDDITAAETAQGPIP